MKLTQKELANKLGINHTTISKWESNTYEPDAENLKKLAYVLDTSTDFLFGIVENPKRVKYKIDVDALNKQIQPTYDELVTFDPLVEINKILDELGIQDIGFFDIEKWKNMSPQDVENIRSHFEWIAEKAKERKNKK